MSDDKTDPRLEVLRRTFDAADRAAGIVRVDTRDEALVERLCLAAMWSEGEDVTNPSFVYGPIVRAVLAALREESWPGRTLGTPDAMREIR